MTCGPLVTSENIRDLFEYADGILTWKVRPSPAAGIGDVAGYTNNHGRCMVAYKGKDYLRARLVWLYHFGWLPDEVDHINRDRLDDRIENLRPATRSEQNANRCMMRNNTSGFRGVYFDPRKNRWAARLSAHGKRTRLGTFSTPEEAFAVVDRAGKEAYGEYWNA